MAVFILVIRVLVLGIAEIVAVVEDEPADPGALVGRLLPGGDFSGSGGSSFNAAAKPFGEGAG